MPISEARDGFSYNMDVLEKYHTQVPVTFDELMKAADKIVKESHGEVVPFFFPALIHGLSGNILIISQALYLKSQMF